MGMDVSGRKPTTKQGEYFRNNVWWWWHPLASYICEVAPNIADHCDYWQTNDGDGLNAEDSAALADKLQQEIDSSRTERFALIHAAWQELTPNDPCELAQGDRHLETASSRRVRGWRHSHRHQVQRMRRQRVRAGVFHLLSVLRGQRAQFRCLPPGVRRLLDLVRRARVVSKYGWLWVEAMEWTPKRPSVRRS